MRRNEIQKPNLSFPPPQIKKRRKGRQSLFNFLCGWWQRYDPRELRCFPRIVKDALTKIIYRISARFGRNCIFAFSFHTAWLLISRELRGFSFYSRKFLANWVSLGKSRIPINLYLNFRTNEKYTHKFPQNLQNFLKFTNRNIIISSNFKEPTWRGGGASYISS